MDNDEYHDITRRLVAMMANQDRINIEVGTAITRVSIAIEGINTTLARLETLVSRIMQQSENGTDV